MNPVIMDGITSGLFQGFTGSFQEILKYKKYLKRTEEAESSEEEE